MTNIQIRNEKLSEEARRLIEEASREPGKITVVQPAAAGGNEMSRATRELVARTRRKFRKTNKK